MFLALNAAEDQICNRRMELHRYWKILDQAGYDLEDSCCSMFQNAAGIEPEETEDNTSEDSCSIMPPKGDIRASSRGRSRDSAHSQALSAFSGRCSSARKTPRPESSGVTSGRSVRSFTEQTVSFIITGPDAEDEFDVCIC